MTACAHLEDSVAAAPRTADGCEDCLAGGTRWVHLRVCEQCGQVGCCDSSKMHHATEHFKAVGHPVMRSIEPGETWRWCYVDEVGG